MGFMPKGEIIVAIFTVCCNKCWRNVIWREKNFTLFDDFQKVFHRLPREVIWCALRRKGVMKRETIKKIFKNIKTSIKIDGKRSKEFEVKVNQDSVLSPLLFAVVMDGITKDVRKSGVKEVLYAGNLVLLKDSWKEVEKNMQSGKKL